jgi:probable F420-dependent oxidoreductase
MKFGAVLPQGRLLLDRGALTAFAQAAQDLGYEHIFCFDHVLGADPMRYTDRPLPFDTSDPFHEPFTTFAFLTACAPRLHFCTGVLILSQRQTALVAKQAAEVDFLSGGKLRIGIGSGWNEVEYEALGMPWAGRGRRLDEQIEILRLLWTQESVTYEGTLHTIDGAGINPLPVQRPIPIWIGGHSAPALRRAALSGDGYLVPGQAPVLPEGSKWPEVFEQIRERRRKAGLPIDGFGFEVRPVPPTPEEWDASVRAWESLGVTHMSVTTLGALRATPGARQQERELDASTTVEDHIAELQTAREALAAFFD